MYELIKKIGTSLEIKEKDFSYKCTYAWTVLGAGFSLLIGFFLFVAAGLLLVHLHQVAISKLGLEYLNETSNPEMVLVVLLDICVGSMVLALVNHFTKKPWTLIMAKVLFLLVPGLLVLEFTFRVGFSQSLFFTYPQGVNFVAQSREHLFLGVVTFLFLSDVVLENDLVVKIVKAPFKTFSLVFKKLLEKYCEPISRE